MTQVAEPRPVTGGGPGETLLLKRAGPADAEWLAGFASGEAGPGAAELSDCIEFGGVVWYETDGNPVAVLCWREISGGWELRPIELRDASRDTPHDRWLLTHVEALAIRHNIPSLTIQLTDLGNLDYYQRLGYEPEFPGSRRLHRRVGGTWQLRQAAA